MAVIFCAAKNNMEKIFIDPQKIDFALIGKAVDAILNGMIVVLPTETVYGLAAYAENKDAVQRLARIKNRPPDKPFAIVSDSWEKARDYYFTVMPPFAYRLMEKFWPGPLTMIYYSDKDEKLGIRIPAHIVTNKILKGVNAPVYLPSANLSGKPEAASAQEVESGLGNLVDLIVDSGPSLYRQASTVVDLTCNPFKILREGTISEREIVDVFIKKRVIFICTGNTCRSPMAQIILEKQIDESKPYLRDRYEIISAGVYAYEGSAASSSIVSLLKEKESMDIRGFRATKLNRQLILSSDLIFTMEDAHTDYVLKLEPTAEGRVFPLRKFLSDGRVIGVPDPIGKSQEHYEEAFDIIKEAIVELKEWL